MKAPENATLIQGELATFWLDEDGILCAIASNVPRTLQRQKDNYALIKKITNNKKVCLLSDTTNSSPHDKETADYVARELPNMFHAMAVISQSVLGQFATNVFVATKQQPIPIQFFNTEEEAREWLKQYNK